jgi:hypothetical protein
MLGTAPCLVSPVVLFELIHRRAAGNVELRVRGTRLRDREHAAHIHGRAIRAWNCLNGNTTDMVLVLGGGVSDESVNSKTSAARGVSRLSLALRRSTILYDLTQCTPRHLGSLAA